MAVYQYGGYHMPRPRHHQINNVKVPFTEEEEIARDAEEKEWADGAAAREMEKIRTHRNRLLAETDWMGNPDVTMSDAWKTYRQELRDIPASNTVYEDADGISAITWPTKPE